MSPRPDEMSIAKFPVVPRLVLWTFLATLGWCYSAVDLFADSLVSITVDVEPICVGELIFYTANDDGVPPATYKWEFRCTEGGMNGNWTLSAWTSKEARWYEARVGSQDIRCTGKYPNHDSVIVRQVTVHGPDTETIIAGLNVNSTGWNTMQITMKFQIQCGATIMGAPVDGVPQERIRRPQFMFDSGWTNPSSTYYLAGGVIFDVKSVTILGGPDWNNLQVGAVFDDFYQQNRMKINNCHSVYVYYPIFPSTTSNVSKQVHRLTRSLRSFHRKVPASAKEIAMKRVVFPGCGIAAVCLAVWAVEGAIAHKADEGDKASIDPKYLERIPDPLGDAGNPGLSASTQADSIAERRRQVTEYRGCAIAPSSNATAGDLAVQRRIASAFRSLDPCPSSRRRYFAWCLQTPGVNHIGWYGGIRTVKPSTEGGWEVVIFISPRLGNEGEGVTFTSDTCLETWWFREDGALTFGKGEPPEDRRQFLFAD